MSVCLDDDIYIYIYIRGLTEKLIDRPRYFRRMRDKMRLFFSNAVLLVVYTFLPSWSQCLDWLKKVINRIYDMIVCTFEPMNFSDHHHIHIAYFNDVKIQTQTHTHTYVHTHTESHMVLGPKNDCSKPRIIIYIYICVCVCVCAWVWQYLYWNNYKLPLRRPKAKCLERKMSEKIVLHLSLKCQWPF